MPTIVPRDGVRDGGGGPGWVRSILVAPDLGGVSAMALERLVVDAGAHGPALEGRGRERFLYVVRGSGTAMGAGEGIPLEHETIVWIEAGDRLRLVAGTEGLEVLIAEARDPAGDDVRETAGEGA